MTASAVAVANGTARSGGYAGGNLMGVGMAPEGLEQNPVVYEFMAEMAYYGSVTRLARISSDSSDASSSDGDDAVMTYERPDGQALLDAWMKGYAARRYAGAGAAPPEAVEALQRAWHALGHTAYACKDRLHSTVSLRGAFL